MRTRVRPARPADAGAIATVHVVSWRRAYEGLLPAPFLARLDASRMTRRWRRHLGRRLGDTRVVELEGDVVGFSLAVPCRRDPSLAGFAGEVEMLYLHPAVLGRGLGRALMGRTLEGLERAGCRWVVVWVLADNRRARGFYERLGLRFDGAERIDRFDGRPVRVVRHAAAVAPVVDFSALAASIRHGAPSR